MGDQNIEKHNVIEEEGILLNDPNHCGVFRYIVESRQEIEQIHELELDSGDKEVSLEIFYLCLLKI